MSPTRAETPGPKRRITRYVAIALLVLFMPIFVFGATVAATGTVTVSVQEKGGTHLWIPVPALLFDLAVFAAPRFMPEQDMENARRELAPYRDSLEMMAEELEGIPAGSVLVSVESDHETVKITKDWRSFNIEVQSPDADVRVSVPARLLSRSLDIFG